MHEESRLDYEQRTSFVSHRQYRRLMALTLLNTILLAAFICGPWVSTFAQTQWKQFQERRERKRVEQVRTAALAAAKAFARPPGVVIYEERPGEAAKLLATGKYKTLANASVHYFPQRPWQPPVQLNDPPPQLQPLRMGEILIFSHALKNPAGEERLVRVLLEAKQEIPSTPGSEDNRRYYQVKVSRLLTARVMLDDGKLMPRTMLQLDRANRSNVIVTLGTPGRDEDKIEFKTTGMFRIYASQPDLADPSHFTIDCDYDGRRAVIDGWLRKDDFVELAPRTGRIVDRDAQGTRLAWDPTLLPATQSR